MTNERSLPQARPEGNPAGGPVCPDPQMLAEYLDGKLDATQRGRIEDHISRCEDCYFVVRETSLLWAELGAQGPGAGAPRPRASFGPRYLLPMAATLMVVAGSITLWRQAHPVEAYAVAVQPLVEAAGDHRFFEPRLAGGFRYGPKVEARRSAAGGPESGAWAVLGVAREMRSRTEPASTGARAGRAAAALFLGQVDQAVAEYSALVDVEPENAEWACNLSAALLLRGSMAPATAGRDHLEALRYADQATRLNPLLVEARFNRGLALEALGRATDAKEAFAEVAAHGDAWSEAAREHLPSLGARPESRD